MKYLYRRMTWGLKMLDWSKKITVADKRLEKEKSLKAQRDQAIRETDWLVLRHRDEIDSSRPTTITEAEYSELLAYRQALRDWPERAGWADTPIPTR